VTRQIRRRDLGALVVDRRQCEIADWTRRSNTAPDRDFGTQSCCSSPSGPCNDWNYFWSSGGSIEDILVHLAGVTADRHDLPAGTLTTVQISAGVDAGKLFVMRWERSNGNGHFILGHGIAGTLIHYMDPWPGEGLKTAEHVWMVSSDTHRWTSSLVVAGKAAPPPQGPCGGKADGAACDDGDACTTGDRCVGGTCEGEPVTCAAESACATAGTCNPATGQCAGGTPKQDGTSCDDGSACTTGDRCLAGVCRGAPRICAPIDGCHEAGVCVAATGTCTTPRAPDGRTCPGGTCAAGVCEAPAPSPRPSPSPSPGPGSKAAGCSSAGAAGLGWPAALAWVLTHRRRPRRRRR
jgi:hypothetical protein